MDVPGEIKSPKTARPDVFLIWPGVGALLIWVLIEGQLIARPDPLGGLLPDPLLLLTMLLVFVSAVYVIVAFIVFTLSLKWRKLLSIVVATSIFISAIIVTAFTTDFVRVCIARWHIVNVISARKSNNQTVDRISWMVTETDDVWTQLIYDETDHDKPISGLTSKTWLDYSWLTTGCRVTALPQSGHYYTERTDCSQQKAN